MPPADSKTSVVSGILSPPLLPSPAVLFFLLGELSIAMDPWPKSSSPRRKKSTPPPTLGFLPAMPLEEHKQARYGELAMVAKISPRHRQWPFAAGPLRRSPWPPDQSPLREEAKAPQKTATPRPYESEQSSTRGPIGHWRPLVAPAMALSDAWPPAPANLAQTPAVRPATPNRPACELAIADTCTNVRLAPAWLQISTRPAIAPAAASRPPSAPASRHQTHPPSPPADRCTQNQY